MDFIRVLGSGGSKEKGVGTTSFAIGQNIAIDAGNIINSLGDDALHIEHIFLTHSHLDHIVDIAFLAETFFTQRSTPLHIYASKHTLDELQKHILNGTIWPDFSHIRLRDSDKNQLSFIPLDEDESIDIGEFSLRAIKTQHTKGSFGYLVTKNSSSFFISGDTPLDMQLISKLNTITTLKALFLECSFTDELSELATTTKHLVPSHLYQMLNGLKKQGIEVFLHHTKATYKSDIKKEIDSFTLPNLCITFLEDRDAIDINSLRLNKSISDSEIFNRILDINLELAKQQNRDRLNEMILHLAIEITKSDGGTLYLLSEDKKHLDFKVVINKTLDVSLGTDEQKIEWASLPLYKDEQQNRSMVAVVSVLDSKTINIKDVYSTSEFNFEGSKNFDKKSGYKTKSMLVTPLINHENDVIGALQLINKEQDSMQDYFSEYDEKIITALASQVAMALTNTHLVESLEEFFDAFASSIASAIDAKSKHTSNHIKNLIKLAPMIAESISQDDGIYKDVFYDKNDIKQFELAAKLHDIGKISIPEWVVDKATKLEGLMDGVELVKLRVELIKKELLVEKLTLKLSDSDYEKAIKKLENDSDFIQKANIGGEFMRDEDIARLHEISAYRYKIDNKEFNLLSDDELYNLSIKRGTLTDEQKEIMNSHVKLSYDMLSSLKFPKKYSKVFEIAVNHHEKLNGKGYPRGLSKDELTLEDSILVLSDIFEALTSKDRPYKGIKKLSEVFKILGFMVKDGEMDGELLEFFKRSKAFSDYVKDELLDEQNDI